MAVTTSSSATIRGISYTRGTKFTCYAAKAGKSDSEGGGSTSTTLTKGKTYYFYSKASGSDVTYPYAVSTTTGASGIIGWYKEAVFPYATYSVKYNANGGTGAPSTQTKTYGTTLKLSTTVPTREGYLFSGWATSSTGSVAYAAGASYTSNKAITLYAVWTMNSYAVSYDANGGTGAPSTQDKIIGTDLVLSSTIPTREGFVFVGWGTSEDSTTVAYAAGGTYTADAAITLYAIWTAACTIAYDMNGGSGIIESQSHTYGVTSILSTIKPTMDEHVFLGWALSNGAKRGRYLAGGRYINNSFVNGDVITLYAVWKKISNVCIQVPDSKNMNAIYINVPDNKKINSIYFKVNDEYLGASDNLTLMDSNENYLMAKGC